jgi:DNA-binding NarL/FixJ family response regulator
LGKAQAKDTVMRPRVVLAEDHAPIARQLKGLLGSCCDVVQTVADGAALIAAVDALQLDVIVSDIAMPEMTGLTAARIILARHPEARIVFVTIRDEPSVVRMAMDCGVRAYVLKGDAGDELSDAISAVLAGKRYLSARVRPTP